MLRTLQLNHALIRANLHELRGLWLTQSELSSMRALRASESDAAKLLIIKQIMHSKCKLVNLTDGSKLSLGRLRSSGRLAGWRASAIIVAAAMGPAIKEPESG